MAAVCTSCGAGMEDDALECPECQAPVETEKDTDEEEGEKDSEDEE